MDDDEEDFSEVSQNLSEFLRPEFLSRMPDGTRRAIEDILQPLYDAVVTGVRDQVLRSAGYSLVSLQMIEILQQTEMLQALMEPSSRDDFSVRLRMIDCYLRLLNSKEKCINLILSLSDRLSKLDMFAVRGRCLFRSELESRATAP